MITHVRHETRDQALRRLLQVARESGVRLLRDSHGEMWTTSASDPGWLHKVEPDSCSCQGFARAGRCRHQATLLSHLGYLDNPEPDPDPTPPAPSVCSTCNGTGSECGTVASGRSWWYESIVCATCHGAGTISAAA
jgi:hypothetical protein